MVARNAPNGLIRKEWRFQAPKDAPLTAFGRIDQCVVGQPVFHVNDASGYYVATNNATILDVLRGSNQFSTSAVIPVEPDPPYTFIPLMIDPPRHTEWRHLMAPYFTPNRIGMMSGAIRDRCVEMVAGIAPTGTVEFIDKFARRFPAFVFLELFGLPSSDLDQFLAWEQLISHGTPDSDPDRSKSISAINAVTDYFGGLISSRRLDMVAGRDDLLSHALQWKIGGAAIPDADLLSFCLFMFIAGLDTVASQLGYFLYHLATNPSDRDSITTDPSLIPKAVEELLRAYPVIQTARKALVSTEVGGCPVEAGSMISLPLAAANRDKSEYVDADRVDFNRDQPRHLAFGAGPHRCIGSHLARLELLIALQEWHREIPEYTVDPDASITEHASGVLGLDMLPLMWSAAPPLREQAP
jgi:cytochrome P450